MLLLFSFLCRAGGSDPLCVCVRACVRIQPSALSCLWHAYLVVASSGSASTPAQVVHCTTPLDEAVMLRVKIMTIAKSNIGPQPRRKKTTLLSPARRSNRLSRDKGHRQDGRDLGGGGRNLFIFARGYGLTKNER